MITKIEALAKLLKRSTASIEELNPVEGLYSYGEQDYLVLTDEQAARAAKDYILDTLWAFRPEFLADYVPDGVDADTIAIIQEKCEDANPAMLKLVGNRINLFVKNAIAADGRGHFLAHYDFKERKVGDYYIYRIN